MGWDCKIIAGCVGLGLEMWNEARNYIIMLGNMEVDKELWNYTTNYEIILQIMKLY